MLMNRSHIPQAGSGAHQAKRKEIPKLSARTEIRRQVVSLYYSSNNLLPPFMSAQEGYQFRDIRVQPFVGVNGQIPYSGTAVDNRIPGSGKVIDPREVKQHIRITLRNFPAAVSGAGVGHDYLAGYGLP